MATTGNALQLLSRQDNTCKYNPAGFHGAFNVSRACGMDIARARNSACVRTEFSAVRNSKKGPLPTLHLSKQLLVNLPHGFWRLTESLNGYFPAGLLDVLSDPITVLIRGLCWVLRGWMIRALFIHPLSMLSVSSLLYVENGEQDFLQSLGYF